MSNFLNNIVQPMYPICSSVVLIKWCSFYSACIDTSKGVATMGIHRDARDGQECGPNMFLYCGCN